MSAEEINAQARAVATFEATEAAASVVFYRAMLCRTRYILLYASRPSLRLKRSGIVMTDDTYF